MVRSCRWQAGAEERPFYFFPFIFRYFPRHLSSCTNCHTYRTEKQSNFHHRSRCSLAIVFPFSGLLCDDPRCRICDICCHASRSCQFTFNSRPPCTSLTERHNCFDRHRLLQNYGCGQGLRLTLIIVPNPPCAKLCTSEQGADSVHIHSSTNVLGERIGKVKRT
jgi:hypothetical protein